MKELFMKALTASVGGAAFMVMVCAPASAELFGTSCSTDEEISGEERAPIERATMEFVRLTLADPRSAYSMFTPEAKQATPQEKFYASASQLNPTHITQVPASVHIEHVYLLKVFGIGSGPTRTICSTVAHGDTSTAPGRVFMTINNAPRQAYAIIDGAPVSQRFELVIWLIAKNGGWAIQHTQFAQASLANKSCEDFWNLARQEEARHDDFNAYILAVSAVQLADRGPNFQLGILQEFLTTLGKMKRPPALQGNPPFDWRFGDDSFRVLKVGPIDIDAGLYLLIAHEVEPWTKEEDVDHINRELMSDFATAYPEYRRVFSGLLVEAHERGTKRGFRTVGKN